MYSIVVPDAIVNLVLRLGAWKVVLRVGATNKKQKQSQRPRKSKTNGKISAAHCFGRWGARICGHAPDVRPFWAHVVGDFRRQQNRLPECYCGSPDTHLDGRRINNEDDCLHSDVSWGAWRGHKCVQSMALNHRHQTTNVAIDLNDMK